MAKSETRRTGDLFEEETARWMKKNGYKIVARNWEKLPHELDIVAVKEKTLVFTEVKSGNGAFFEAPETRIDEKKMRYIAIAAKQFVLDLKKKGIDVAKLKIRFDAAAITFDEDKRITEFRYYENYFKCHEEYYEIL